MRILAIDSSTKTLCVAVSDGKREYGYSVDYATRLSRWLVPALARVLEGCGLSASEIDHFACGAGPGSFTGLRIGMSCVKGLAWARSAPVCGVSSLEVIAMNARQEDGLICGVLDARRSLVYAGLYRVRKGRLARISPDLLITPAELLTRIAGRAGKRTPVVFCGDGIPVIREHAAVRKNLRFLDADNWKPQPRHLMELTKETIARRKAVDAQSLKPVYLYPKECQVRPPQNSQRKL